MHNKLTFEEVRERFNARGYVLLESSYISSSHKMRFLCHKHPEMETRITLNRLSSGQGCRYCGVEKRSNGRRLSEEDVIETFRNRGYTLLDKYTHSKEKLRYICEKHPGVILTTIFSDLKRGYGCTLCGRERTANASRGKNSPQWKGGVTELGTFLRQLLSEWKYSALEKYSFRCAVTGEKGKDLEIHHTVPFHIIRDVVLAELGIPILRSIGDYSEDELSAISSLFIEKHSTVEGIPLKKQVHIDLHKSYGVFPTAEDFSLFKSSYTEVTSDYAQVV